MLGKRKVLEVFAKLLKHKFDCEKYGHWPQSFSFFYAFMSLFKELFIPSLLVKQQKDQGLSKQEHRKEEIHTFHSSMMLKLPLLLF